MIYKEYNFADTNIFKLLGRTKKEDSSLMLPWSYGGIAFNFTGTGLILSFKKQDADCVAYLRVTVDGKSARYGISDGREVIIIEGLEEGTHYAEIIRVTEGMTPVTLDNIKITGTNPVITDRPSDKKLKIEFIGDSITCGYGVAAPAEVNVFNTYEEDCTLTYAYAAAKLLDADISFAGASGKGIVANCVGNREDMTLRQAFDWETRQGGRWNHNNFIPNIVVVNAGTNDAWGGVSHEEYIKTAVEFTLEIRECYPDAAILWVYGIMDTSKLDAVEKAVELANATDKNKNVHFLAVKDMNSVGGEVGGGGHPNVNTTKRVAPLLAGKIKEILNLQ
ncbi:MAG: GDSL-type esterase/lipase family protein [Eubacteriales bacterium]|jgi:lysophospholipase L1-like esterase